MTEIAAIDVALWDIKAKALGVPLYQLLGGKSREGVLVYPHANGTTNEEALDAAARTIADGYLAVRLQSGMPGPASTYGVANADKPYEPAERGLPTENIWSTEKYLVHAPRAGPSPLRRRRTTPQIRTKSSRMPIFSSGVTCIPAMHLVSG